MQPSIPPTLMLASRGVNNAGESGSSGLPNAGGPKSGSHHSRHVRFTGVPSITHVSTPAVGLATGAFARNVARITNTNGMYSSTAPSTLGPWKCTYQAQPQASTGQRYLQTGAARIVPNPQAKVKHWQMEYTSPMSGSRVVAVRLHGNIQVRTTPNKNCTYQCANFASSDVLNAILDHRYPGWGHVTLPCGLFCWVQL